jgi:hypothetical protein
MLKTRMGQFERQIAVVGQQHQPAAVFIEPADCVQLRAARREIEDCARVWIRFVRSIALGFVERDIDQRVGGDALAVDAHIVIRAGVLADLRERAVDGHAAVHDQLFAFATRAKAGFGEVFLEAHGEDGRRRTTDGR